MFDLNNVPAVEQLTISFDYAALDTETRVVVQQRTSEIKALMKRAAQDIIEIGQKLIGVKARLDDGKFSGWLRAEFDWSRMTAYRYMWVYESFGSCNTVLQLDIPAKALYLLAAPSTPETARTEVLERAERGEPISYSAVKEIVQEHKAPAVLQDPVFTPADDDDVDPGLDTIPPVPFEEAFGRSLASQLPPKCSAMAVHYSSDTDKWNTPPEVIERVLMVLGAIDLDPCSNSHETPNVPAEKYYTEEDDGLSREWQGRVYMNPPYGRIIGAWVEKLCASYESESISEAIALVPARTDTAWFQRMRDYAICLIDGRLKFGDAEAGAPFPSVAVYLGSDVQKFYGAFSGIGDIWVRWKP